MDYSQYIDSEGKMYFKKDRASSYVDTKQMINGISDPTKVAEFWYNRYTDSGYQPIATQEYQARQALEQSGATPGRTATAADIQNYEKTVQDYMSQNNMNGYQQASYDMPNQSPEAVAQRTAEFQQNYNALYGEGAYQSSKQQSALPQTPEFIYTKDGKPFDPSKYTNLQPGTAEFDSWTKENNIQKVSTAADNITAENLMDDQTPDLLTESNKMNLDEQAQMDKQYYGAKRDLDAEKNGASDLAEFLDTKTVGGKTLRQTITSPENWYKYVNAYVYGGYSMQDIANDLYARATGKGGGIVHPNISRGEWFQSQQGKLPGQGTDGTAGGPGVSGGGMSGGMGNTPTPKPTPNGGTTTLNNPYQQIVDKLMNLGQEVSNVFDKAAEKYGLMDAGDELNNIESQMADAQIRWRERERQLRSMTGSQNAINRTLSEEGRIANAELADLAIRKAVAQNDWERAYQLTTTAAEDFKEAAMYQVQALEIQGKINEQQAQEARAEIAWFNDLQMAGYAYLTPGQAANVPAEQLIKLKNPLTGEQMIFKAPYQMSELEIYEAKKQIDMLYSSGEDVKWGVVGTDEYGSSVYGFIDTKNQVVSIPGAGGSQNVSLPGDGQVGGQCGVYIHNIMDGVPTFGDTWQSKQAAMNVSPEAFKKAPQVGDIVAFKTALPYGHVATVIGVNGDKITLSESNYGLDEKVSNNRTASVNDQNILGAYRGATFKNTPAQSQSNFTPEAMAYAQDILAGRMGIENVPGEKMKNQVILAKNELEKTQKPLADQLMADGLGTKIKDIDSILSSEGMSGAVGVYAISRWTPFKIDKDEKNWFIAAVDQLVDQETIDKLIQSKAAGATYGALSENEQKMLRNAATKINSWRKEEDGKVWFEISEEKMKTELNTIKSLAQKAKDRILGDSVLLPPGQISDDNAYQIYINNSK